MKNISKKYRKIEEVYILENYTFKFRHSAIFIIVVTIISTAMNLQNFIYSSDLSKLNIMATFLFLFSWFIFGLLNGRYKKNKSILFAICYLGLAGVFFIIGASSSQPFSFPIVLGILNITPLYALIFSLERAQYVYIPLYLIIPIIFSIIGYLIGSKRFIKETH